MAISLTSDGIIYTGTQSPGQSAGSGAAYTLDDYEEGTWTPLWQGSSNTSGGSYNAQQGEYTKIGNIAYLQFFMVIASEPSFGGTYIMLTGFPFAGAAGLGLGGMGGMWYQGHGVQRSGLGLQLISDDTKAYLTDYGNSTAIGYPDADESDLSNTTGTALNFHYRAAG